MQVKKCSLIALAISAAVSQMAVASQQSEAKGFVEGSKLKVLNRNMYMNRDFKHGQRNGTKSYGEEWAHGLITTYSSGFTQGTVGFGVDAFGLVGIKLDSGDGRNGVGTGLLEINDAGEAKDDQALAGAAAKLQISNTVLKYGNQMVSLPVLAISDSRLLPESVTGGLVTSNEIEGLTLNAGHFTALSNRNQSSRDSAGMKSLDLAGGTYKFSKDLIGSAYWAETEDYFRKYYGNLNYSMPLSDTQAFIVDFNMYDTKSDGLGLSRAWDGEKLDNQIYSLAAAFKTGAHTFTLSHQRVTGDGGYVYGPDGNSTMYTAHSMQVSDFNQENEKSWAARYDLNMAAFGVPGLTFMTRYIKGTDFNTTLSSNGKEWERDVEAKYVLQDGPAKDLSFRVRWGTRRTADIATGNMEDLRVFVEYPLNIL
ncbi:OprD family porin [Pseudomonas matsuisoli]|uniref:Porin n=1 Tax=Pseudomonas matsuisoli TaxID=1515666 RepID=A0A917Q2L1_9PSED|nr:OprD family porin [Pseudomonas matsuisoli]GGK08490.1 porin [Pseudomonas matsuisoli]